MKKKLSMLLVLSLILSLIPASAIFASNGDDDNTEYENGYDDTDMDTGATPEDTDDDADVADEPTDDDVDMDTDEATADEDEDVAVTTEDVEVEEPEEMPEMSGTPIAPISAVIEETPENVTLRFVIGDVTFTRNDVPQELEVAPYIEAGRTMVPLAAISAGLDASVRWDAPTRTVHIERGIITLAINVDEPLPGDMGMPAIVDGRTFVPLAYVSEMLGATTRWDPANRAVYVTN